MTAFICTKLPQIWRRDRARRFRDTSLANIVPWGHVLIGVLIVLGLSLRSTLDRVGNTYTVDAMSINMPGHWLY